MERTKAFYRKNRNAILSILGLLVVSIPLFLYLILGENSYVEIHDQLDGEVLNYMYRARYWLNGRVIPEFMNGMDKASMAMPAPFGIVLYRLFPPFYAYVLMQWLGVLTGFAGMYALLRFCRVQPEICFLVAVLFACLPFYPVYGLAGYGQPLLVLCALRLAREEKSLDQLGGILIYAGFSSLTLVGYVWVLLGLCGIGYLARKKRYAAARRVGIGWLVLCATYVATNLELLGSVFGTSFATHRAEMALSAQPEVGKRALGLFFWGGAYNKTYSALIFAGSLVLCLLALLARSRKEGTPACGKWIKRVLWGNLAVLVLAFLSALWSAGPVVGIRRILGGMFAYFQADRVYWIFPFVWFVILAFLLQGMWTLRRGLSKRLARVVALLFAGALVLAEGALIARDSTANKNIRLLLVPGYEQMTWRRFFMDEVFAQIDGAIGEDKGEVSTLSLGLYPSIPLYHGYTCADGYSNNYRLEYKHRFRKVIAGELAKNEQARSYFDDWGNRLYAVSGAYGFSPLLKKGSGIVFEQLSFDLAAMQELHIGYVFAAAPIENAKENGLVLLAGSPFSSAESYYEIWVYQVK